VSRVQPTATATSTAAATERNLRATSLLLDDGPPIDPFSLAGPSGVVIATEELTLVGIGTAMSIPLPRGLDDNQGVAEVQRQLAAIDADDRVARSGSGVLAFGALPFARETAGALVVPELLYGRSADGTEWATLVTDGPGPTSSAGMRALLLARSSSPRQKSLSQNSPRQNKVVGTAAPSVTPLTSERSFMDAVARSVRDIGHGDLDKVVLARQIDLAFDVAVDVPALLTRWRNVEPTATIFSIPVDGAQFVGASPELLVAREGDTVRCQPLAGTSSRPDRASTDPNPAAAATDDLRQSPKNVSEHRLVVEAIADALGPLCTALDVPASPDLIHFHNVSHLGTSISGTLSAGTSGTLSAGTSGTLSGGTSGTPSGGTSGGTSGTLSGGSSGPATVLELVATLHPTPAVGGIPRERALRMIGELESTARDHYAGPVGWMDAHGDGRWVIGIRAATIAGRRVRLAAGVGIVAGSDPRSELRETNWKFTAVFDALAPGRRLFAPDSPDPLRAMSMPSDRIDESPRRAG
jgi:menaquinone-specific isochorismate synthase